VRALVDRAIFDACSRSSTARFAKSLHSMGFRSAGRSVGFFSTAGCCALSSRRPLGVSGPPVPSEPRRSWLSDANGSQFVGGSPCSESSARTVAADDAWESKPDGIGFRLAAPCKGTLAGEDGEGRMSLVRSVKGRAQKSSGRDVRWQVVVAIRAV